MSKKISLKSKILLFISVFVLTFLGFYSFYIFNKTKLVNDEEVVKLNDYFSSIAAARMEEKEKSVIHKSEFQKLDKTQKEIYFNDLYTYYSKKYNKQAATDAMLYFIVAENKSDYIIDKLKYWTTQPYLTKFSSVSDSCKYETFCNYAALDMAFKLRGLEYNYRKDTEEFVSFLKKNIF